MPTKQQALLEASRRGLLSPEKDAAVKEAFNRGLITDMPDYSKPPQSISEGIQGGLQLLGGTGQGALEGATFGWGDELSAGASALAQKVLGTNDKPLGQIYHDVMNRQRALKEKAGASAKAAELAGGLVTGAGLGDLFAGSKLANLPSWVKLPGSGAVAGGVAGAGFSNGGLEKRLQAGGTGAAVGSLTGLGTYVGGNVARNIVNRARRPAGQATREIAKAFRRDRITPQRASRRLQKLGQDSTIADAGDENTLGLVRAAQSEPGPAKSAARRFLYNRDLQQSQRVTEDLKKRFGDKFAQTYNELEQAAKQNSKPLYDEAFQHSLSNDAVSTLSGDPVIASAAKKVLKTPAFQRELSKDGGQIDTHSVAFWDAVKKEIDDKVGKAVRSGADNQARMLRSAAEDLRTTMDAEVPSYAKARAAFAGPKQAQDAMEMGAKVLNQPEDVTAQTLSGMSEGDKPFFQLGVMRAIRDKIDAAKPGDNVLNRLLPQKVQNRLKAAFPDEKSFRQFKRTILQEARKRRTKDALGGSPTARIQSESRDLNSGTVAEAAAETKAGYPGFGVGRLAGVFLKNPDQPINDATSEQLARMLFNRDPAQQQQILNQVQRQMQGLGPRRAEQALSIGGGTLAGRLAAGANR